MEDNKDLVWDLEKFQKRQKAQDFVLSFENKICVFSGAVGQLYTNYDIFFPKEEDRKLVILPDPYSPHDTFSGLPEEAVSPTGLLLVPAADSDNGKMNMIIPVRSPGAKYRKVPLSTGLNLINKRRPESNPFLPVLVKGDLRELNASTPCLHLHSLNAEKLTLMSNLEVDDIRAVILERLKELSSR